VTSAENLKAAVEGDIEAIDGVLRITRIRLRYEATIPKGARAAVERALGGYAEQCPAYQSIKGCIDVTWEAAWTEEG
jgi:uncharacterized OsmC-like protein